ncbi:MAG TPA: DUF488 domain-containing protein [Candidatus Polarisedimenticolia bacterium]|nr:DUF488 domain-containing protein [Candidatus Polarisedimenticolia bacterium]
MSPLFFPGYSLRAMPVTVYTVGHSNRSLEALLGILRAHGIECLADVRSVPRSRHNPQFNAESLAKSLPPAGIDYAPVPRLGGLRTPRADSRNLAFRNDSFRGYADYMESPEFDRGIADLLALARAKRTAIMCAEAIYDRCHRSLISDALVCRGVETLHVLDEKRSLRHPLSPSARIVDGRPTYPAAQGSLPDLAAGEDT